MNKFFGNNHSYRGEIVHINQKTVNDHYCQEQTYYVPFGTLVPSFLILFQQHWHVHGYLIFWIHLQIPFYEPEQNVFEVKNFL
jgi:hypothetical protein